uniref:NADH-ubiquinone oxidoreductase chain 3 n=1 Tax=Coomaniella copipes TaxID=2936727 RepID=A0A8T9VY55_9COLE|nr:NADH dehydrogenase subunit 3 [Coomaniella copipes]UPI13477.1 NADH dehydrogenase subunit 3 [Coomaniella copipes]
MFFLMNTAMLLFIIVSLVMALASILSKKTFSDREKNSPFECGFDPKSSARMPFSLQFFLIAVIFLIFDVEITLLLPLIFSINMINLINYSFIMLFFIIILLIGVYHEWNQGALTWSI